MVNTYGMTDFESAKNLKAGTYTLVICVCLALLFFFVKWTTPGFPPPMVEEGIEVNLGNSDFGSGTDQPFEPGAPSPQEQQSYTPPRQVVAEDNNVKEVETDDREEDAPVVKNPPVVKPDATKITEKDPEKIKPVKTAEPVATPAPVKQKPKGVMGESQSSGTGGNEADSYKKGGSEGIAGGKGDQGKPGGDPNSKNYEGNGGRGNSGVSISKGLQGRRFTSLPSFEDEFNENARVAVDIKVDESGQVISAAYQPRGSTTTATSLKEIALRKARQIKLSAGTEESSGTIVFNFRLRN